MMTPDLLQLTNSDINEIRGMSHHHGAACTPDGVEEEFVEEGAGADGSGSTPTSLISHPDLVDAREGCYKITYDITPDSSDADSADLKRTSREMRIENDRQFEVIKRNLDSYPLDYDARMKEKFSQYEDVGGSTTQEVLNSYASYRDERRDVRGGPGGSYRDEGRDVRGVPGRVVADITVSSSNSDDTCHNDDTQRYTVIIFNWY